MATHIILWIDIIILITTVIVVFVLPCFCGTELYMAYFYNFFFVIVSVITVAVIAPVIMMYLKLKKTRR